MELLVRILAKLGLVEFAPEPEKKRPPSGLVPGAFHDIIRSGSWRESPALRNVPPGVIFPADYDYSRDWKGLLDAVQPPEKE